MPAAIQLLPVPVVALYLNRRLLHLIRRLISPLNFGRRIVALLSFCVNAVHHADQHLMVHKAIQNNGRTKRGPSTAQGRQNQIISRLAHGIRSQSPVLLPVEMRFFRRRT